MPRGPVRSASSCGWASSSSSCAWPCRCCSAPPIGTTVLVGLPGHRPAGVARGRAPRRRRHPGVAAPGVLRRPAARDDPHLRGRGELAGLPDPPAQVGPGGAVRARGQRRGRPDLHPAAGGRRRPAQDRPSPSRPGDDRTPRDRRVGRPRARGRARAVRHARRRHGLARLRTPRLGAARGVGASCRHCFSAAWSPPASGCSGSCPPTPRSSSGCRCSSSASARRSPAWRWPAAPPSARATGPTRGGCPSGWWAGRASRSRC